MLRFSVGKTEEGEKRLLLKNSRKPPLLPSPPAIFPLPWNQWYLGAKETAISLLKFHSKWFYKLRLALSAISE